MTLTVSGQLCFVTKCVILVEDMFENMKEVKKQ